MRIYLKNENCVQAGQVTATISDTEAAELDAQEARDEGQGGDFEMLCEGHGIISGDEHYREGSAADLIAEAEQTLRDLPGTAVHAYRHRCDRAVIAHLK